MSSVHGRRRNPQRIAIHKSHLRAWRTAALFQRYWAEDQFRTELAQFFAGHQDILVYIAQLHPDEFSLPLRTGIKRFYDPERPWCTLPATPHDRARLRCYDRNLRMFLELWDLHRLSDDRGYAAVHGFCFDMLCDVSRFGTSGRCLGSAEIEAAEREPVPLVGEVIGYRSIEKEESDGTRRWVASSVTRPRIRVELTNEWDATNETWHDAEKRLKNELARLLRQEMNRLVAMEEEKGFVVADTDDRASDAIDWFFRRFVMHDDIEEIARGAFLSVGTIRNRTNDLARVVGFCTPKTRKRTS